MSEIQTAEQTPTIEKARHDEQAARNALQTLQAESEQIERDFRDAGNAGDAAALKRLQTRRSELPPEIWAARINLIEASLVRMDAEDAEDRDEVREANQHLARLAEQKLTIEEQMRRWHGSRSAAQGELDERRRQERRMRQTLAELHSNPPG